jgi:transposase-like protein
MARRGRPPKKLGHVDALETDATTKARMRAILETLSGELSVPEACERLEMSETRFHELRQEALQAMLQGIEPRPPGRPPKEPEEDEEVAYLKARLAWVEEELQISRTRTEIALFNPKLLRDPIPCPPPEPPKKKGSLPKGQKRPRRRKRGGTPGT